MEVSTSALIRYDDGWTKQDIQSFARKSLFISLFFWLWALLNSLDMYKGFDLGIISFSTTICSSLYLLSYCRKNHRVASEHYMPEKREQFLPLGKFRIMLVAASHFIVAANYALGFWFAMFVEKDQILAYFGSYCFIFTCLWLWSARLLWKRLKIWNEEIEKEQNELEKLYSFEHENDLLKGSILDSTATSSVNAELEHLYDFESLSSQNNGRW